TRSGSVRIFSNGTLNATPFLTTAAAGIPLYTGGEGGFLGMAFSPTFATDHKFYTLQTETYNSANVVDFSNPEQRPTTATNPNNHITLREWTTDAAGGNPSTPAAPMLRINHPQNNHQGGSLRFGSDGNLYL